MYAVNITVSKKDKDMHTLLGILPCLDLHHITLFQEHLEQCVTSWLFVNPEMKPQSRMTVCAHMVKIMH